ncbi:GNAT family N-acetyltransferase [Seonamhaeicola sp. MEBiC1930]|uniref:GNAT family N-acetyltransferase n=1 Tax=Seonamhaeicola sp. MEBiC01930 TaxID=2976768 RepID=UPI003244DD2D
MKVIKKVNFYTDLFEKSKLPKIYKLKGVVNNTIIFSEKNENDKTETTSGLTCYKLFPNYFDYKIETKNEFKLRKVWQKLGFSANLNSSVSALDYLKKECSSQHKKNVTRATNRLEQCFEISYFTYFGKIEKSKYISIMNALFQMISNRFKERKGKNRVLTNWQYYLDSTFELILQKKASLFVIYSKNEPIEVSINYHFDSIMYSSISSYDLDYSKFSLGNIEIYKQIDWCISNNIKLFDMGYGDFDYKRKWSNHIYKFESHIISKKNNLLALLYPTLLKYRFKIIDFLVSKNVNNYLYNLKDKLINNKSNDKIKPEFEIEIINEISTALETKLDLDNYTFLKKPIYDFLYKYKEELSNLSVYKTPQQNSYIVKGKNNNIKITHL